jgi:hypothetical protein
MADRGMWGSLILALAAMSGSAVAQESISVQGAKWRDGGATPVSQLATAVSPAPEVMTPTTFPEMTPNLLIRSGLQGTGECMTAALAAPNLFGDQFGSRALRLILPGAPAATVTQTFTPIDSRTNSNVQFFRAADHTLEGFALPPAFVVTIGPASFIFGPSAPLTFTTVEKLGFMSPRVLTLLENGTVTSGIQSASPGQVVTYKSGIGGPGGGEGVWPVFLSYLFTTPATTIEVLAPMPGAGGAVGRTKIADDNSPLPQDRVIFDYDYFNNVPLSARGVDVNRFSAGFEKTFFDGRASLELRLPFATTLSSDVHADGGTSADRVELGDLNLTLKALLYGGPVVNVAAGLGLAVPTANDVRVFAPDGTPLLRIKNEEVVLTPYLAYLVTPTDRLFIQNWVAFGFDTNGNSVSADFNQAGLQHVGRLHDQTLCQIDAQLGYWLIRNGDPSALLRGLAPFVELHYNATLGNADQIQANQLSIGAQDAHVDELNLSAGVIALVGERLQLAIGAVVPLKGGIDRKFDWQVGVHGSYYFGPSARGGSRAAGASSF